MFTSGCVSADTGWQTGQTEPKTVLLNVSKPTALVSLEFKLVSGCEAGTQVIQPATLYVPTAILNSAGWLLVISTHLHLTQTLETTRWSQLTTVLSSRLSCLFSKMATSQSPSPGGHLNWGNCSHCSLLHPPFYFTCAFLCRGFCCVQ